METFTRQEFRDRYLSISEQTMFASDYEAKCCQHFVEVQITHDSLKHFLADRNNYKGKCLCFSWEGKHQSSKAVFGFEFKEDMLVFILKYQNA